MLLDAEAEPAIIPSAEGMVGVMARREPMMLWLGTGRLLVRRPRGRRRYFVSGGVAHFRHNHLTLLAERCQEIGT